MRRSAVSIALLSLLCTYAFFYEYRPPLRKVHLPFDLAGYHYPLAAYAFESLKAGRWPQWDPTIYGGMEFTGNTQAALFYPGTWLMFLASWGRDRLSYQALEDLTLAHVWVAFLLCYFWLRGNKLNALACALGASVYAFSGYMCLQLQHFGLIAAYTWFPLALRGIDQSLEQGRWRPLVKLVAASSLAFLGGYPPMWAVFALLSVAYAAARPRPWKAVSSVAGALAVSLLVCAMQLLPAWELTKLREPEAHYGSGYKDPLFYVSYISPNYYNFGLKAPVETNPGKEYLYLGAPGLLGLMLAGRAARRRARDMAPLLAVLAVSLFFLTNPRDLALRLVQQGSLLYDVVRDWYFLSGVTLAAAGLAAYGLDWFLSRPGRSRPLWLPGLAWLLMGAWAWFEVARWRADAFPYGRAALADPAVTLLLFALGLFVFRAQQGQLGAWAAAALLVSTGVDYKVFGTSKRFNASTGPGPRYARGHFPAMADEALAEMQAHARGRVLLEEYAPQPAELRFLGLLTPQGFDPFLSGQYRAFVKQRGAFLTDRDFRIDPANYDAMRVLGVRYVITAERGARYQQLQHDPRYRVLGPGDHYYKIFEYTGHHPPYGLNWPGTVSLETWTPERRVFTVDSAAGGRFTFSEQFSPGWSATVDGQPVSIERWETAFQAIRVPAGRHRIEFCYHTPHLLLGAAISAATLLGLVFAGRRGRSPAKTSQS